MLPVMASLSDAKNQEQSKKMSKIAKFWDDDWLYDTSTEELWGTIEQARFPLKYMANLFSAGDEGKVADRLKKLMAVRMFRRRETVGDISEEKIREVFLDTGLTTEMANDIYYLTSLAKAGDRFVIPAAHREQAIEMMNFTGDEKGSTGFGFKGTTAERGL
jgi:nitrate reductase beta subunit